MRNSKNKKTVRVRAGNPRIGSRLLALVMVMCFIFVSCTPASSPVEETGGVGVHKKLIRVGFSQLGAESDWRRANTASMQATFSEENGYQLILEDAQQKQANQAMSIRRFIQQGVDYIVVAPVTEVGWENVLGEAKAAGIPVILIDRQIDIKDATLYSCWIGSNFRLEGDKVTAWLEQYMKRNEIPSDYIHIFDLQGSLGASAQLGRTEGLSVAAKKHNWDVVDMTDGDFTEAKGYEVTARALRNHPEINVIYAENDNMALGALKALREGRRTAGMHLLNGEVMVLSFDGVSTDAMQMLIDRKIACIGECYPLYGSSVRSAIEMLEDGKKPEKQSFVNEGLYSADSTITQVTVGNKDYPVTIITQDWLDNRNLDPTADQE